jgi:regulation of enolase protein 1 (concanavalin A-like superfamily)
MSFSSCTWLNAPKTWRLDDGRLLVLTDGATDFWRGTHYNFTHDSGHFFGCDVAGDFTMQLRVRANYDALYDQAGIMVRLDAKLDQGRSGKIRRPVHVKQRSDGRSVGLGNRTL